MPELSTVEQNNSQPQQQGLDLSFNGWETSTRYTDLERSERPSGMAQQAALATDPNYEVLRTGDPLIVSYPAARDIIQNGRNSGLTDAELWDILGKRDFELRFGEGNTPEQVDAAMGRTDSTKREAERLNKEFALDQWHKATNLPKEEILKRMEEAMASGLSVGSLLTDEEFYQKAKPYLNTPTGIWRSAQVAYQTDKLSREKAQLIYDGEMMTGERTPETTARIEQIDAELASLSQQKPGSVAASVSSSFTSLASQQLDTLKGLSALDITSGTLGAAIVSAGMGGRTGAMLAPTTAMVAASGYAGLNFAWGTSMARETMTREAAGAYEEMRSLGVSHDTAAPIAYGVGAVNAAVEMSNLESFNRLWAGAFGDLSRRFGTRGLARLISTHPTSLQAFLDIGLEGLKEIGWETTEEILQHGVGLLGTNVALIAEGQPGMPISDILGELLTTGTGAAQEFGYGLAPNILVKGLFGANMARVNARWNAQTIRGEAVNQAVNAAQEAQAVQSADTGNAAAQAVANDYVFISQPELERYKQSLAPEQQAALDAQLGIGESAEGLPTGEYIVRKDRLEETFNQSAQAQDGTAQAVYPGLQEALAPYTRETADSYTQAEVRAAEEKLRRRLEAPIEADTEMGRSARAGRELLTRQLLNAGVQQEQARVEADLAARFFYNVAEWNMEGMTEEQRKAAKMPEDFCREISVQIENAELNFATLSGESFQQGLRKGLNLDEKIPVLDLSKVNSEKGDIKPSELRNYLRSLIGGEGTISRDSEGIVQPVLNSNKAGHLAYSSLRSKKKKKGGASFRKRMMLSLEDLIQNSILVESGDNTKKDKKPSIERYHRFYVPVRIEDKLFTVRIVAEEVNGSGGLSPVDVNAYDMIIDKTTELTQSGFYPLKESNPSFSEITIRDMLKNVKGMDGESYAQFGDADVRGSVTFNGSRSIVTLFESADESTFLHELGHIMLNTMVTMTEDGNTSESLHRNLSDALKFLGLSDLDFTDRANWTEQEQERYREGHEKFAQTFERYLRDGKAPSQLKKIFQKVKQWLLNIYKDATDLGVEITPEIQALFDRLLTSGDDGDATLIGTDAIEESLSKQRAAALKELREQRRGRKLPIVSGAAPAEVIEAARYNAAHMDDTSAPEWLPEWYSLTQAVVTEGGRYETGREKLNKAIRDLGGISKDSVESVLGRDAANELFRRNPSLFSSSDTALAFENVPAYLPASAEFSGGINELYARLMGLERQDISEERIKTASKNKKISGIEIDENSLPYLLLYLSNDEIATVARARLRELEARQAELTDARQTGVTDDSGEFSLRTEGPKLEREKMLINELLTELEAAKQEQTQEVSDADDSGATQEDVDAIGDYFAEMARQRDVPPGGAQHESIPTQTAADRAAGVLREDELIPLRDADRQSWKRAQRISREAYKAGLADQRAKMQERARERKARQKETQKLLKSLARMSSSTSIAWDSQREIEEVLSGYTLKRTTKKKMEMAQEMRDYLNANPGAREKMSPDDLKYVDMLDTIMLQNMSLADLRDLTERVEVIYRDGAVKENLRRAEIQEAVDTISKECHDIIKIPPREPTVPKTSRDLKKQYKGVKGAGAKVRDSWYALTLSTQRLLDWLGSGNGKYDTAFTKYFSDMQNACKDEEMRRVAERQDKMYAALRELGFTLNDLAQKKVIDGQEYTLDELMHIYAAMGNDYNREAVLYGNLRARFANPEVHAQHCIESLTESQKAAARLVMKDFAENTPYLSKKYKEAFNIGIDVQENYVPMHRLQFATSEGVVVVDSPEALESMTSGGVGSQMDTGFLIQRKELTPAHQAPIELGLFSVWQSQLQWQEHVAAYGKWAQIVTRALNGKNKNGVTLKRAIGLSKGQTAEQAFVSYLKRCIQNNEQLEADVMKGVVGALRRNMATTYISLNPSSAIKQFTSLPRFLSAAGPSALLRSAYRLMTDGNAMLKEIYEKDLQMRSRKPLPFWNADKLGRQASSRVGQSVQALNRLGGELVGMTDRWTAAVGWWAVYESNLERGMSEMDARREAQRVVALTQQAVHPKDMPLVWQQHGWARLQMMFTSDAVPTVGALTYDLVQAAKRGEYSQAAMTITGTALSATLMGLLIYGVPDGDDDDSWADWLRHVYLEEGLISQIPVVGKSALTVWNQFVEGGRGGTVQDALVTPLANVLTGIKDINDDKADEPTGGNGTGMSRRTRGIFKLVEGLSLLNPAGGVPVNALRRFVNAGHKAWNGDAANALRTLVGQREKVKRMKKAVWLW